MKYIISVSIIIIGFLSGLYIPTSDKIHKREIKPDIKKPEVIIITKEQNRDNEEKCIPYFISKSLADDKLPIKSNYEDTVEAFALKTIDNYNTPSHIGFIHLLASTGELKKNEFLLNEYPDQINSTNWKGFTPIYYAVREGHLDSVELLIKHGANLVFDHKNNLLTAALKSSSKESLEIMDLLIEQGLSFENGNDYIKAAFANSEKNNKYLNLILKNTDLSEPDTYSKSKMVSPSVLAVIQHDKTGIGIKHIIDHKINLDIGHNAFPPLHAAVMNSSIESVQIAEFIKLGADVNAVGYMGRTPLFDAIQYKKLDVVKVLLKNGADKYTLNRKGEDVYSILKDRRFSKFEREEFTKILDSYN